MKLLVVKDYDETSEVGAEIFNDNITIFFDDLDWLSKKVIVYNNNIIIVRMNWYGSNENAYQNLEWEDTFTNRFSTFTPVIMLGFLIIAALFNNNLDFFSSNTGISNGSIFIRCWRNYTILAGEIVCWKVNV